jgi:dephospho-CoA kinase
MYLIGLTGGIACGKSTVLAMLRERGAQTIDADRVTHELQQPGEPVYAQIVAAFGEGILVEPGGPIDRKQLGGIVFSSPADLRRLELIVHPAVHAHILAWLESTAAAGARVAVIDAVKLLEAGWKSVCDSVWVVTCPAEQQIERLVSTRGMSEAEARTRIAAQPPQESRVARADVVIDNGGALDETARQVEAAWRAIGISNASSV